MLEGEQLNRVALPIRLLLMDCDGVLTDGRIVLLPEIEDVKFFHAVDGHGMKMAARSGLKTGIITTRESKVLGRRAREMHVTYLFQRAENKLKAFEEILAIEKLSPGEVAFVGDDLPDLAVLRRVGLPVAVSHAVAEVKSAAKYVTKAAGGCGAVREVVELILRAQGKWEEIVAYYAR